MTDSTAVRQVRPPRPASGTWTIDPDRSRVTVTGHHRLGGTIRGRLPGVSGTVRMADDPTRSEVDVLIDLTRVDFGNGTWNRLVQGRDLLGTHRGRQARFRSTRVHWDGARGAVDGQLSLRGVTGDLRLHVTYLPERTTVDAAVFTATGRIDRQVFDLHFDLPLPGGNRLLGREVTLDIHLVSTRRRVSLPQPRAAGRSARVGAQWQPSAATAAREA